MTLIVRLWRKTIIKIEIFGVKLLLQSKLLNTLYVVSVFFFHLGKSTFLCNICKTQQVYISEYILHVNKVLMFYVHKSTPLDFFYSALERISLEGHLYISN